MKDKGSLAGRVTSISRQAQSLFPPNQYVSVVIQTANDEQILIKKVGNLTVALNDVSK